MEDDAEIWIINSEYPDYQFSSLGRVRLKYGEISKNKPRSDGYMRSSFTNKEGKTINKLFHVLIAETFIPRIEYKEFVNHKNGIRHDNRISNLEWVSKQENNQSKIFPKKPSKERKVIQYHPSGEFIKIWPSIKSAAKSFDLTRGNLSTACKKERAIYGGYIWRYYDDIIVTNETWAYLSLIPFDDLIIQVSSYGRCRLPTGYISSGSITKRGYVAIHINSKTYSLHRLVCQAFHPIINPLNYQVNHIDGNKQNNNINNLEYVTAQENSLHAHTLNRHKGDRSRLIGRYSLDGNFIDSFKSLKEASEILQICKGNISSCCHNKRTNAGGFIWKYLE